jgi:alpha-L-rhamnosidase
VNVTGLRCEYRTAPLGIDVRAPRLDWALESPGRNQKQSAYQVVVRGAAGVLWDSGRVESDQSAHVVYAGRPLTSHTECRWRVRVWDQDGRPSPWSDEASWSMGLLSPDDWQAEWIALPGPPEPKGRPEPYLPPCPYFRKEFSTAGPVARAGVYATALGLYEIHLNGRKVGADYFTPGWTDYNKRVYYNTYDVTGLLREGGNALGAILAEGWYSGHVALLLMRVAGMPTGRGRYGDRPALRVQLRLEYADGSVHTHGTDGSWRVTTGPHREADILMGESYDARLAAPGWDLPGFDDSSWQPAAVCRGPRPKCVIQAYPGVTVQETQTLPPSSSTWGRTSPGACGCP